MGGYGKMAIINCPECGKEGVSDKAVSCPSCAYGIKEHFDDIRQQEEKRELDRLAEEQRVKQLEVDNQNWRYESVDNMVNMESVTIKQTKKKKSFVKGALIFLVLLIVGSGIFYVVDKKQNESYRITMVSAYSSMLKSLSSCADIAEILQDAWLASVLNGGSEVSELFAGSIHPNRLEEMGMTSGDYMIFVMHMSVVTTHGENIELWMNDLKNPPRKYKEFYERLLVMHEAYEKLSILVTSPSDTFVEFAENFYEYTDILQEQMAAINRTGVIDQWKNELGIE